MKEYLGTCEECNTVWSVLRKSDLPEWCPRCDGRVYEQEVPQDKAEQDISGPRGEQYARR